MENKVLTEEESKNLENLKLVQYALADAHFKLTTRVQYLPEDFDQAIRTIGVLVSFHTDITKKVEEIESPKPKDEEGEKPKKPYIMDVNMKVPDGKT